MTDQAAGREGVFLEVKVMENGTVEIWTKDGMSGDQLAGILREIVAGFEGGEAKRIR